MSVVGREHPTPIKVYSNPQARSHRSTELQPEPERGGVKDEPAMLWVLPRLYSDFHVVRLEEGAVAVPSKNLT